MRSQMPFVTKKKGMFVLHGEDGHFTDYKLSTGRMVAATLCHPVLVVIDTEIG